MRKLISTLLKYLVLFIVILLSVAGLGRMFRQQIVPIETFFKPKIDRALIMAHLKVDTAAIAARIDTTLTPEEELEREIETARELLKTRLVYIDSIETNVQSREDSVGKLRGELLARQSELTQQESDNIVNLAKLFNSMKPEQAVTVILQLSDQTAVEILYRMKEREAGKLIESLAQSDPVRAADITERYKRLVPAIKK